MSNAPTRKITAVGLAGAIVTVLLWCAQLAHIDVPPTVAAAATTILTFAAGYLVADR